MIDKTPDHIGPHANQPILHEGPQIGVAERVLVLVHGRGGSAEDMLQLGRLIATPMTALVAPSAAGSTWYPQRFIAPREQNEPFVTSALAALHAILEKLPPERTILCGFSQGACLTSQYLLENGPSLRAAAILTGGVIGETAPQHPPTATDLTGVPVLLTSGDPDPHIPWTRVEETAALLQAAGARVDLHHYPGRPHTVSKEELELLRDLL